MRKSLERIASNLKRRGSKNQSNFNVLIECILFFLRREVSNVLEKNKKETAVGVIISS
jgi:hypothetical protein